MRCDCQPPSCSGCRPTRKGCDQLALASGPKKWAAEYTRPKNQPWPLMKGKGKQTLERTDCVTRIGALGFMKSGGFSIVEWPISAIAQKRPFSITQKGPVPQRRYWPIFTALSGLI